MFQDMDELASDAFEVLRSKSEARIEVALRSGEYVGWLGSPANELDVVAGGAGVQVREVFPHPKDTEQGSVGVAEGRHGIVINVFTEPSWRKQGLAALLLTNILNWAAHQRLDRLVLHASRQGRSLYEHLGFVPTNEMRYVGNLMKPFKLAKV
jgi:GNAT superfamily N-acetyltransferase